MSDHSQDPVVFVEPDVVKVSARTAAILLIFTLAFTALMAGTYTATLPLLRASAENEKLRLIGEVLPKASYDNALLTDALTLSAQRTLGTDSDTTLYRARKGGQPSALVFETAASDGYSGRINLLMAVSAEGKVLALRVTQHRETPGLGDYIDPKKDRNKARPWISQFNDIGFELRPSERWRVKKDGGDIDQMSGATISARAVTNASRRALEWVLPRRDALFGLPAASRYEEAP